MPEFDSTIRYADIPGIPGYCAGSDGSIWSCWIVLRDSLGHGTQRVIGPKWKQLKPTPGKWGHLCVILKVNGKRLKLRRVHQIVLTAFVGACPEGMVCRHFPDRNPANNHISNLQWGTPKENAADAIVHGTSSARDRHGMAKLTWETVRKIRSEYVKGNGHALAVKYGVSAMTINRVVRFLLWKE
jgi:hypothetical protein